MFTVSRVDIDRDGPTYTIDTLRDIRAQRPDSELFFITGDIQNIILDLESHTCFDSSYSEQVLIRLSCAA